MRKLKRKMLSLAKFLNKNSSLIFTVAESVGVVATSALTVDATVKTMDIIRDRQTAEQIDIIMRNMQLGRDIDAETVTELTKEDRYKLTPKETIDIWWKPVTAGGLTIAAAIANHKMNMAKQASLVAAAGIGFEALNAYRQQSVNLLGKESDEKVLTELIKAKDRQFVHNEFYLEFTDPNEEITMWDEHVGYFLTTPFNLLKAEYEINYILQTEDCITLEKWYQILGVGDYIRCPDYCRTHGWTGDQFFEEYWYQQNWFNVHYNQAIGDDGMETYLMDYSITPIDLGTVDRLAVD